MSAAAQVHRIMDSFLDLKMHIHPLIWFYMRHIILFRRAFILQIESKIKSSFSVDSMPNLVLSTTYQHEVHTYVVLLGSWLNG